MINFNKAEFLKSCTSKTHYPTKDYPQIAFAGRSNVGKSSIINTLLNRKKLARISQTPGKTQEINFYTIDEKLFFVDLPGYGYAKVAKTQKKTWAESIEEYLIDNPNLRLVILLVDIRHDPSEDDMMMYKFIRNTGYNYMVVATKSDKLSKAQILEKMESLNDILEKPNTLIPFSSSNFSGKEEVMEQILKSLD